MGDIFSIVFTEKSKLLILGCQNTSIQWYDFEHNPTHHQEIVTQKDCQKAQFFRMFHDLGFNPLFKQQTDASIQCVIKNDHVYSNAHDGYVYCMKYAYNIPNLNGEALITGAYMINHYFCEQLLITRNIRFR